MADRKKLFVNFAKKISELSYSQPKVLKRTIRNSDKSAHLLKSGRVEAPVIQPNNKTKNDTKSDVKNNQIKINENSNNVDNTVEKPNIVFENSVLKAYIERGVHKREKKFALHDHLFYIKVQPKKDQFPLLVNILDFLEEACNHILNEVKEYYKLDENRIAFLTLYQQPLLNGE